MINFPTRMTLLALGEPQPKQEPRPRYFVVQGRDDDKAYVKLRDDDRGMFISFDWRCWISYDDGAYVRLNRWWLGSTPASRIRQLVSKAQARADQLNHQEMYLRHEAEIAERRE